MQYVWTFLEQLFIRFVKVGICRNLMRCMEVFMCFSTVIVDHFEWLHCSVSMDTLCVLDVSLIC